MSFGIDYVSGPPIADLKSAGVTFVCRYLSEVNNATQIKLLQPAEAKALSQAGIAIVSNYEWYGNRAAEGFASGVADAKIAEAQHANCGGPADRPIYFSVDADVSGVQVFDYFKGVASVIGRARTGAYGSYRVIRALFDNGLITWGWQTYAWSAGQWEPRRHIEQYENGVTLAGRYSVDYNHSIRPDFGQWFSGGTNPDMMLITDLFAVAHFTQTATNPDRWHCAKTGFDLFAGILGGWQKMNGAPRLPTGGEVKCGTQAVYQECESGIMLYDPLKELDAPFGPWAPCYLLKLDSDLAKKLLGIAPPTPTPMPNILDALSHVEAALAAAGVVSTELGKALPDLKQ